MSVYILWLNLGNQPNHGVLGVYATEEAAIKARDSWPDHDVEVHQWTLRE
jgi:hypothetical protein